VISPRLFAMLVFMAVVTTMSTTPILQALSNHRSDADLDADPNSGPAPAPGRA
jgi:hypothetical protein